MTRVDRDVRRRRRNQLLLVGLLPSLVALVVAAVLLVTLTRNVLGERSSERGDQAAARQEFAANRWVGAVESWVAPYNEGVASLREASYDDALDDFLVALRTVPTDQECRVLANVALAQEGAGDRSVATDDDRDALDAYRRGRAAIAEGRCLERTELPPDVSDLATQEETRLTDKIEALLDRQEQQALARLTPEERHRVEDADESDRKAAERDQRIQEQQAPTENSTPRSDDGTGVEYGW